MCISCLFLKREKLKILRERVFEDNNNKIFIKKNLTLWKTRKIWVKKNTYIKKNTSKMWTL